MSTSQTFVDLPTLAQHLRDEIDKPNKKFILLYAYNGTGKTRLSGAFRDIGKQVNESGETTQRDTLYFNAFTEDLFHWDNDLDTDELRVLELNAKSTFFDGLGEFEIENRVRTLLDRYASFGFRMELNYRTPTTNEEKPRLEQGRVTFTRDVLEGEGDSARLVTKENIKISRGEERIFVWCFFLAIVEIKIDPATDAYDWVKYIYIDDPISSLDEQNAVAIAVHLASILKDNTTSVKTVVSTHHPLFFNVLYNELHRIKGNRFFFLGRSPSQTYSLIDTGDTPFFHHVACLLELHEAARSQQVFTYHFNQLRVILEKTAGFLGYDKFVDCIVRDADDQDGLKHNRLVNLLSHGKYSLYEPRVMLDENKMHFTKMLSVFTERFVFNPERFPRLELDEQSEETASPGPASGTTTTDLQHESDQNFADQIS